MQKIFHWRQRLETHIDIRARLKYNQKKETVMKKLIFVLFSALFVLFCSACISELPYNATIADKAENFMKEEYLAENKTHCSGSTDTLPDKICKIIQTEEEYAKAFNSFPEETDFKRDILVVYFFTDIYYGFDCKLQKITNDNGEITIEILHRTAKKAPNGSTSPSTSSPTQRCLAVKLTDCDYTDINVNLIYE